MYYICYIVVNFTVSKNASIWVTRYLFHKLLGFWRDISHSRQKKCNQFQPKGNVEKAETRNITDFPLMSGRKAVKGGGTTVNVSLPITMES